MNALMDWNGWGSFESGVGIQIPEKLWRPTSSNRRVCATDTLSVTVYIATIHL